MLANLLIDFKACMLHQYYKYLGIYIFCSNAYKFRYLNAIKSWILGFYIRLAILYCYPFHFKMHVLLYIFVSRHNKNGIGSVMLRYSMKAYGESYERHFN